MSYNTHAFIYNHIQNQRGNEIKELCEDFTHKF